MKKALSYLIIAAAFTQCVRNEKIKIGCNPGILFEITTLKDHLQLN